nr:unnamed protein product [Callosobruchus analis]
MLVVDICYKLQILWMSMYLLQAVFVAHVSHAVATLRPQKVKMPEPREHIRAQNEFYNIARYPKTLAAIDCTHVMDT